MFRDSDELLPLSEHLTALRGTILRSLCAFAAAFALILLLSPTILSYLTSPYAKAVSAYSSEGPLLRHTLQTELLTNEGDTVITRSCENCSELPLEKFNGAYQEGKRIILPPKSSILIAKKPSSNGLVLLSPAEGFLNIFKIAFWGALTLSSPAWGFFLYRFIAPALDPAQTTILVPFALASIISMTAGIAFSFYCVIPAANAYLLYFNSAVGENLWSLSHYLDYTLLLVFANAIAFELGAILFCGVHSGFLRHEQLARYRRHAIVGAFILAALLTPPDILTQFLLAVPLCVLYEAAILYARFRHPSGALESFLEYS